MLRSTLSRFTLIPGGAGGDDQPLSEQDFTDLLWLRLRQEAREAYARSPMLAPLFVDSIINQPNFDSAVFHRIATRLKNEVVGVGLILEAFNRALECDPDIGHALRADIAAVVERDPACARFIEPFLYFKGFHAIQTHRLAHWLWGRGERDFALYLQSRSSDVFQTDIHPAAHFGRGVFLDHATGLVVGETAVVEDNVSLLQNVTLGGTGKEIGDRHPKIRHGAVIGAGAKILGNIEIGAGARVAAGSVVLRPVEAGATVAGVPAKVIRSASDDPGAQSLDQIIGGAPYDTFDYGI